VPVYIRLEQMVEKIISGGQVGADIAALRVAKRLGIPTGGLATKDFRILGGTNPELGTEYNLVELESITYPPRTYANVETSDGTMRFAYSFLTAGERCTMKAINKFRKPYFDVGVSRQVLSPYIGEIEAARAWIEDNHIRILNVAGNAVPGIEPFVEEFLEKCLSLT
jgi:hypothetical protein